MVAWTTWAVSHYVMQAGGSDSEDGEIAAVVPRISIEGVSKEFRHRRSTETVEALRNVSLDIEDNSFVTIVGPSGCGKTTLLRLLNGLVHPDEGRILIDGRPPVPGPDMGFVFQSFRLLPWRTVLSNVTFGLEATSLNPGERGRRGMEVLQLVGLHRVANSYPAELSGGMKQRVALARALVVEPQLLLMDEPFASLDAQNREILQIELLRLWEKRRGIVLFVTHSVDEAILLSDKIVLMSGPPGQVAEVLNVDLPRPRWDYDVRARPEFGEMRRYLWEKIKEMVDAEA